MAKGGEVKYRAVGIGLEQDGHPVQALFMSWSEVCKWASLIIEKHHVDVDIFKVEERKLTTMWCHTKDRDH